MPSAAEPTPVIELCGDDLLTIATATAAEAQALAETLRAEERYLEVVAGMDSVAVQFDATTMTPASAREAAAKRLVADRPAISVPDQLLEIPVVYGGACGPDLDDLCERTGLSAEEFIALHSGAEYRVDLVGFTPGFVYVGGLDERLNVPRLPEPRQHVPAGSVGIADGRTGLYALPGPGGWPLIGRTSFTLFDAAADDPFPVRAGMRVRFFAVSDPGDVE